MPPTSRIVLAHLSKRRLGEDPALLLGALLVSAVELAALSRADVAEEKRRDLFVFLDELQCFATASLAGMMPEMRKYRVCLTLSHQHLTQLDPNVRDAVLGNVGTLIAFRLGVNDAEFLAPEFRPEFGVEDFIALPNHRIILKLMIDGRVSWGFGAGVYVQMHQLN